MLKSQSEKYKVTVRKSKVPKMDWKEKYETLISSSKNFESWKTYKGGRGALAPRPPLQVFERTKIVQTGA